MPKNTFAKLTNFFYRLGLNFRQTSSLTRASSLAFTLLLSFVPFTISLLSILSWIPLTSSYSSRIEKYIFNNFLPHTGRQIYPQVMVFMQQADNLSILGFSSLIITTYMMLFTIERQLNAVWHDQARPGIFNSLLTHTLFLASAPLIILTLILTRVYLHHIFDISIVRLLVDHLLTTIITIALFSLVYKVMPAHIVRPIHALIGGSAATILFNISKHIFIFYSSVFFANYNIIYGSLAFIPLFLIWIYLCSIILMFGAQIVYCLEGSFNPKLQSKLHNKLQKHLRYKIQRKYLWRSNR